MTTPLAPPRRKNPVERTRAPTLPPPGRSREALGLTAMAAEGRFALQVCDACATVQYPPRQLCGACLSGALTWRDLPDGGALLAETTLHHSNDLYFRERLPWRLGLVALDCGPRVVAHVMEDCEAGERVRLATRLDRSGQAVMLAMPQRESDDMRDDRQLRETTCEPRDRRVLVSNGRSPLGAALVEAVLEAGAREVYVGDPERWRVSASFDRLRGLERVRVFDLDVTDSDSVRELAGQMAAKVDILVNSGHHVRPGGVTGRLDVNTPRTEMDVYYLGLLRLAREFGPVMRARGADGDHNACAWVNLLSIHALSPHPEFATWSAALAAAHSASLTLRAELYRGGVKVINVYPGPIEDEWHQLLPPPKLAPRAVATAVVAALRAGVEDAYPGAVASETLARLRENPKEVEREVSL